MVKMCGIRALITIVTVLAYWNDQIGGTSAQSSTTASSGTCTQQSLSQLKTGLEGLETASLVRVAYDSTWPMIYAYDSTTVEDFNSGYDRCKTLLSENELAGLADYSRLAVFETPSIYIDVMGAFAKDKWTGGNAIIGAQASSFAIDLKYCAWMRNFQGTNMCYIFSRNGSLTSGEVPSQYSVGSLVGEQTQRYTLTVDPTAPYHFIPVADAQMNLSIVCEYGCGTAPDYSNTSEWATESTSSSSTTTTTATTAISTSTVSSSSFETTTSSSSSISSESSPSTAKPTSAATTTSQTTSSTTASSGACTQQSLSQIKTRLETLGNLAYQSKWSMIYVTGPKVDDFDKGYNRCNTMLSDNNLTGLAAYARLAVFQTPSIYAEVMGAFTKDGWTGGNVILGAHGDNDVMNLTYWGWMHSRARTRMCYIFSNDGYRRDNLNKIPSQYTLGTLVGGSTQPYVLTVDPTDPYHFIPVANSAMNLNIVCEYGCGIGNYSKTVEWLTEDSTSSLASTLKMTTTAATTTSTASSSSVEITTSSGSSASSESSSGIVSVTSTSESSTTTSQIPSTSSSSSTASPTVSTSSSTATPATAISTISVKPTSPETTSKATTSLTSDPSSNSSSASSTSTPKSLPSSSSSTTSALSTSLLSSSGTSSMLGTTPATSSDSSSTRQISTSAIATSSTVSETSATSSSMAPSITSTNTDSSTASSPFTTSSNFKTSISSSTPFYQTTTASFSRITSSPALSTPTSLPISIASTISVHSSTAASTSATATQTSNAVSPSTAISSGTLTTPSNTSASESTSENAISFTSDGSSEIPTETSTQSRSSTETSTISRSSTSNQTSTTSRPNTLPQTIQSTTGTTEKSSSQATQTTTDPSTLTLDNPVETTQSRTVSSPMPGSTSARSEESSRSSSSSRVASTVSSSTSTEPIGTTETDEGRQSTANQFSTDTSDNRDSSMSQSSSSTKIETSSPVSSTVTLTNTNTSTKTSGQRQTTAEHSTDQFAVSRELASLEASTTSGVSESSMVSQQSAFDSNSTELLLAQINYPAPSIDEVARTTNLKGALPFLTSSLSPEMQKQIGIQWSETFVKCYYSRSDCLVEKDFRWELTASYGSCFTFNYNDSAVRMFRHAGPQYGLSLTLYTYQKDFICTTESAGFKVSLQEQTEPPFPETSGIYAMPGVITSTIVYRTTNLKNSDCTDNDNPTKDYYYDGTYTVEGCMRSCHQKYAIDRCGCADPRYPKPDDARLCDVADIMCLENFLSCSRVLLTNEQCSCKQVCREVQYSAVVTTSFINFELDAWKPVCERYIGTVWNGSCQEYLQKSIAVVNLYYDRLYERVNTEEDAYSDLACLSDLFSWIGVGFGVCVGTVLEIGFILLDMMAAVLHKKCKCGRLRLLDPVEPYDATVFD